MTYDEARQEFAVICKGRYRSMHYELIEREDGTTEQTCRLYVHSGISTETCATWSEAMAQMRGIINPAAKPEPEITTPQGEQV